MAPLTIITSSEKMVRKDIAQVGTICPSPTTCSSSTESQRKGETWKRLLMQRCLLNELEALPIYSFLPAKSSGASAAVAYMLGKRCGERFQYAYSRQVRRTETEWRIYLEGDAVAMAVLRQKKDEPWITARIEKEAEVAGNRAIRTQKESHECYSDVAKRKGAPNYQKEEFIHGQDVLGRNPSCFPRPTALSDPTKMPFGSIEEKKVAMKAGKQAVAVVPTTSTTPSKVLRENDMRRKQLAARELLNKGKKVQKEVHPLSLFKDENGAAAEVEKPADAPVISPEQEGRDVEVELEVPEISPLDIFVEKMDAERFSYDATAQISALADGPIDPATVAEAEGGNRKEKPEEDPEALSDDAKDNLIPHDPIAQVSGIAIPEHRFDGLPPTIFDKKTQPPNRQPRRAIAFSRPSEEHLDRSYDPASQTRTPQNASHLYESIFSSSFYCCRGCNLPLYARDEAQIIHGEERQQGVLPLFPTSLYSGGMYFHHVSLVVPDKEIGGPVGLPLVGASTESKNSTAATLVKADKTKKAKMLSPHVLLLEVHCKRCDCYVGKLMVTNVYERTDKGEVLSLGIRERHLVNQNAVQVFPQAQAPSPLDEFRGRGNTALSSRTFFSDVFSSTS
ncbi:unnamed protein product [Amoebophrya sp. A25]|nr:unnamed protein product [Amoebophrya sp. A25]|eukprot:GSA25T00020757001.1